MTAQRITCILFALIFLGVAAALVVGAMHATHGGAFWMAIGALISGGIAAKCAEIAVNLND